MANDQNHQKIMNCGPLKNKITDCEACFQSCKIAKVAKNQHCKKIKVANLQKIKIAKPITVKISNTLDR